MTSHRHTCWFALMLLTACASPANHTACHLGAEFAQLQAQLPDQVGSCSGPAVEHLELGQTTQQTTTGQLAYDSLDGIASFSDGSQTWVLDSPTGQAQVRALNERFPWEFNGDGLPLVGQPAPDSKGACPTTPVRVLAVENFYADLADQIGGQCVQTTTILADPDADPHEFQPAANDVRAYQNAQLVIENGLGYDDFSDRVLSTLSDQPAVVNAGQVLGMEVGANPHVWYSAADVDQIRAAILSRLRTINPEASPYYDAQSTALDEAFSNYHQLIGQIESEYADTPVGSTESIFVGMADATHLHVISPPEFMNAVAEGNDVSARDIATLQNQITNHRLKVLVYNTQTVTSMTEQLKGIAQQNGIPIVGVSETMPEGAETFQGWQASELRLLLRALQQGSAV